MPRIEFDVTSGVSPDRFIAALTDFSPKRAEIWPNIDAEHLKVHEVGGDWADVTEGSSLAGGVWERNRYDWSTPGTVRVETTESNTWRPGSLPRRNTAMVTAGRHRQPHQGHRRPPAGHLPGSAGGGAAGGRRAHRASPGHRAGPAEAGAVGRLISSVDAFRCQSRCQ